MTSDLLTIPELPKQRDLFSAPAAPVLTKETAREWLRTFSDTPDELRGKCKHGHRECSTNEGGECLDDMLHAAIINVESN